ncbi:hypothetical protein PDJAM_G00163480 [Pangasius djambal]|uniref:Uncharacterized protein n=1 Tax=Pangasius djambal TaxID=1691987 RepID=A0ACC5ZJG4_9TELE|nr:hypothetical protein [Pangasius djambal]
MLMEKYRDGQRELHCVFVDLEKAYDRVPREELWCCMRKSGVAEKYVRVVQDMYERSRTVVRCAVGQTEEFKVEVGLHQGSALSPFLFAMVMDQLSEEVRQESPYTKMFADDIVICSESREQVEENLERWRFALERRGMKVSRSETEYMCVNEREGSGTVRLQGEEVKKSCVKDTVSPVLFRLIFHQSDHQPSSSNSILNIDSKTTAHVEAVFEGVFRISHFYNWTDSMQMTLVASSDNNGNTNITTVTKTLPVQFSVDVDISPVRELSVTYLDFSLEDKGQKPITVVYRVSNLGLKDLPVAVSFQMPSQTNLHDLHNHIITVSQNVTACNIVPPEKHADCPFKRCANFMNVISAHVKIQ